MPRAPRILLAEADEARRAELFVAARDEGLELMLVSTAAAALSLLTPADDFAAAIVALDLPDADGVSFIARLRAALVCVPLLLVVHNPAENTVVRALNAGASDVIAAPFRPALLRAQLRARLRGFAAAEEKELAIGPYRLHIESRVLRDLNDRRRARLTEKEAALLRYLLRASGRPVGRDELLREVWGYGSGVRSHTVATHIHRLRRKVEAGGPPLVAKDERGYRLHHVGQPETTTASAPQSVVESLVHEAMPTFSNAVRQGLFPSERRDLMEAHRDLAFGLPAAALFHVVCVTDSVLRRYHEKVTGADPKPEMLDWIIYVEDLRRYGADDKILASLQELKDFHRHAVIHPDAKIDIEKVRSRAATAESVIGAMVAEIHAYEMVGGSTASSTTLADYGVAAG